jgi:hypothetical protein
MSGTRMTPTSTNYTTCKVPREAHPQKQKETPMLDLVDLDKKTTWLNDLAEFTTDEKGDEMRKIMASYIRTVVDEQINDFKDDARDMLERLDEYDPDGLDKNL